MQNGMENHRHLLCLGSGQIIPDDGVVLQNPACKKPSLLRTAYQNKQLRVREDLPGIFRFADWLPCTRILPCEGYPLTYRSKHLAHALGLTRLFVTFSGYWPDKGARMRTGTFKECEAYAVCARLPADLEQVLVIASAGNTARAFIQVASESDIPVLVVVPQNSLPSLWICGELNPCVKVLAAGGGADYSDAIRLAQMLCEIPGFLSEGGAKNVARRDGMGTTVLSAVEAIGEIPDFYFQAVGSGTGAIAAWEAHSRLVESGQFGDGAMRLIVSQNSPFTPMADAWENGRRVLDPIPEHEAKKQISAIEAKMLGNRQPPYGIVGGLYDALAATGGDILRVDNETTRNAQRLFREQEGCDICPEAGVALASLMHQIQAGAVHPDACIMLNITGGGEESLRRRPDFKPVPADGVVDMKEIDKESIRWTLADLYEGESP